MNPFLLVAWIACQGLDGATTVAVLKGGGHESNPVMKISPARMTTVKVSINVGALIWHRKLSKAYPTHGIKYVLPGIAAGTGCAAATHNVGQLQKR